MPMTSQMLPLYAYGDQIITGDDIVSALQTAGIKAGDVILVHSKVSAFGKFLLSDRQLFFFELEQALRRSVEADGTLVMPTFSYSFCNDEVFDVEKTSSTVGVLTEHFRTQPGVARTKHPIFSVAISGRHRDDFINASKDSFDGGSIFGQLHRVNAKMVFFGASFESCTFVHYIEQAHGIPYRYLKSFTGIIRERGQESTETVTYNVRFLDRDVVTVLEKFENHLLEKGFMKRVKIGSGVIEVISCEDAYREGMKLLDQDIYFFLQHPVEV